MQKAKFSGPLTTTVTTLVALLGVWCHTSHAAGSSSTSGSGSGSDFTGYVLVPKGSYADRVTRSMQSGPQKNGYTIQKCVEACPGKRYVALQVGSRKTGKGECRCEDSWQKVTRYGTQDCGGGQNKVCSCAPWGGRWCNFVFEVVLASDLNTTVPEGEYLPFANATSWQEHQFPGNPDPESFFFNDRGGWADTSRRALRYGPHQYGYTKQTCRAACPGYRYIALQNDGWCSCTDSWREVVQHGNNQCGTERHSNCDCGGTSGGAWCNAVYEVGNTEMTSFTRENQKDWWQSYRIIGSYPDRSDHRALSVKMGRRNVSECLAFCRSYRYFSLQDGQNTKPDAECYCSNSWASVINYTVVADGSSLSRESASPTYSAVPMTTCGAAQNETCNCSWVGGALCNYVYENLQYADTSGEVQEPIYPGRDQETLEIVVIVCSIVGAASVGFLIAGIYITQFKWDEWNKEEEDH